jgi:hypothetical protein
METIVLGRPPQAPPNDIYRTYHERVQDGLATAPGSPPRGLHKPLYGSQMSIPLILLRASRHQATYPAKTPPPSYFVSIERPSGLPDLPDLKTLGAYHPEQRQSILSGNRVEEVTTTTSKLLNRKLFHNLFR